MLADGVINGEILGNGIPREQYTGSIIGNLFNVEKHLLPISLTHVLSKVTDDWVVKYFLKPAVLAKVDQ